MAFRWGISQGLALRLVRSAQDFKLETGRSAWITSGARTREQQDQLRRQGRPAAADDVSTHRSCPATGADIWLGPAPTRVLKATWGRIVTFNGLRWGGWVPTRLRRHTVRLAARRFGPESFPVKASPKWVCGRSQSGVFHSPLTDYLDAKN